MIPLMKQLQDLILLLLPGSSVQIAKRELPTHKFFQVFNNPAFSA